MEREREKHIGSLYGESRERSCEMWYDHYIGPLQIKDDDFLSFSVFFFFPIYYLFSSFITTKLVKSKNGNLVFLFTSSSLNKIIL